MKPRVVNHDAHGVLPAPCVKQPSCSCRVPDTIRNRTGASLQFLGEKATEPRFAACFAVPKRSFHVLVSRGGVSCVVFTEVPLQEPRGLTGRICATSANDNNHSKFNGQARTEMSGASMGRGFGSPIWLLWLSPPRQKRTWRSLLASMRERLAGGLRTTMSRPLTCSASSSAKSCVDITSAVKPRRRPF